MNTQEAENAIRKAIEQSSGKPVLIIADPDCPGYASIKTASDHEPAHLLRQLTAIQI